MLRQTTFILKNKENTFIFESVAYKNEITYFSYFNHFEHKEHFEIPTSIKDTTKLIFKNKHLDININNISSNINKSLYLDKGVFTLVSISLVNNKSIKIKEEVYELNDYILLVYKYSGLFLPRFYLSFLGFIENPDTFFFQVSSNNRTLISYLDNNKIKTLKINGIYTNNKECFKLHYSDYNCCLKLKTPTEDYKKLIRLVTDYSKYSNNLKIDSTCDILFSVNEFKIIKNNINHLTIYRN